MQEKEAIELTNRVYRQTLLFPKKEPLRYRVREVSDDILEKIIEWEVLHSPNPGSFSSAGISHKKDLIFDIEKNIELIKGYFSVAKWQNWVSYFDILRIEEEYDKIKDYFKLQIKELESVKKPAPVFSAVPAAVKKVKKNNVLDGRKQKIMEILESKGAVQVKDIKDILSGVSKRTLRRDFDALLKQDLVERIGESNNTYYKVKN